MSGTVVFLCPIGTGNSQSIGQSILYVGRIIAVIVDDLVTDSLDFQILCGINTQSAFI